MALIGPAGTPRPARLGIEPALGYILGGAGGLVRAEAGERADHEETWGRVQAWPY